MAGCGAIIDRAPFSVRPDSLEPGDLIGPFDGQVVDADSDRPLAGVIVQGSWAFDRGVGLRGPAGAQELTTETGADGRYRLPSLKQIPSGGSSHVGKFTLIVYKRGYVGWRSDGMFPDGQRRRDFSQRGNRVRLVQWQDAHLHHQHLMFLGGGATVRAAASWEAQAATAELDGEKPITGTPVIGTADLRRDLLNVKVLLSADEIRGVTGHAGEFDTAVLTDLPTTEFYDSRHFKARGKDEGFDVAIRVWRLGDVGAETQYRKLLTDLPGAKSVDELGDASLRARDGVIEGLAFLSRERGLVVSVTCGKGQCPEADMVLRLARLIEGHLSELSAAPKPELPKPPGLLKGPLLLPEAPNPAAPRRRSRRSARGRAMAARLLRAMAAGFCFVVLGLLAKVDRAYAWDPATTHAGLTQRAALASTLHRTLAKKLGKPLGLFEPLQMHVRFLSAEEQRGVTVRLESLDPEGGYRPDPDGTQSALAWLTAGAVLAQIPAELGRHHFLEPATGLGLDDAPGMEGQTHALRLAFDGVGSLRGLFTGSTFDLRGRSALQWAFAPDNQLGWPAFADALQRSVVAGDPDEREFALARALVALGGVAAVLENMGEPAHVRNDFRGTFFKSLGPSPWETGPRFQAFVAQAYGRTGIPAPGKAVARPTLASFFMAPDGQGLAQRTQRRFFSDGTVPPDLTIDAQTTPAQVRQRANEGLVFSKPGLPRLDLGTAGRRQYVRIEGRRVLAYERNQTQVVFGLDEAVHADSAKALLPEIGAYVAGFFEASLRGGVTAVRDGDRVQVKIEGLRGTLRGAKVQVVADVRGQRRALGLATPWTDAGFTIDGAGALKKIGVVVQGEDDGGPFIAAAEVSLN